MHRQHLIFHNKHIAMKNLKTVIKRTSSPKAIHSNANPLQPLSTQRSKANSQQIFKKYNHGPIDLSKQSFIPNKYRIATQPIDDHVLQLTKSYAKLSRSKRKEVKIDSQHNSIKSRQKTVSNEKYTHGPQSLCANCQSCEKEILILKQQVKKMMKLKQKWKNGQLIVEDFIKDSQGYKQNHFTHESIVESLDQIRTNFIDLMKDIEVLTQIDYPKLLSHNIFNNQETLASSSEEVEIKLLLQQLREQSQGRLTLWDLELESGHENFKVIIRNLKTNLMHSLRENLQLKAYHFLPKKDGSAVEQDIRRVVFDILMGLKR